MELRLHELDLNLLVAFEALLAERNVTRAAARVRRSQPALSAALGRLREALGDPLFVRTRSGVTPTPRALELQEPVRQALGTLRDALEPQRPFDPTTAKHTFLVAASDHAQLLFVPALAGRLGRWPGLTIRVLPLPERFPMDALERGELDLVVGVFDVAPSDRAPRGLMRQVLAEERLCVVGRRGHPALRRPDFARLAKLPQLNVSPRGGTTSVFEARRLAPERNVLLFVPHYLTVPFALTGSDLLAVLPERVTRTFAERFELQWFPLERAPRLPVRQLWHPRAQHVAAHVWLRQQVHALATNARGAQ